MHDHRWSRRELLRTASAVGVAGAIGLGVSKSEAAPRDRKKMRPLSETETAAVDAALGKKGRTVEAEGVYTVPLPRADLTVTIQGDPVPTALGFGGWVSFKKTRDGKSTVLMSDTVLLQEEVNGVLSAAQTNGLEVTAIHNHFFYEQPRIFYMHVHGMGDVADLAQRYARAIGQSKLFPGNQPPAREAGSERPGAAPPERTGKEIFDLPSLDRIVGYEGAVNGPTYKYTIGRDDLTVLAMNAEITAAIGLNSWAAFAGTMDRSHIAGDIAMREPEVNPVIRALRRNNLEIVALHNHMLGEEPRMIFLHYYGTGSALALARGFRAALDELGRHGRKMNMRMHR